MLPQKSFVVLALLHLSAERRAARGFLASWLYEDAEQGSARANLRQLLSRIQHRQAEIGLDLIEVDKTEVRLPAGPSNVVCDVDLLAKAAIPADAAALQDLVQLYRGDLLESLPGSGETLEGWIGIQRTRLRDAFIHKVLAGAAAVRGREGEAALAHLLDVDPYREDVWRGLIDLRAESQGVAAAAAVHEEMRGRFSSDLGTAPDARTAAFMSALTQATVPAAALVRAPEAAPDPATEAAPPKLCLLMPSAGQAGQAHVDLAGALVEDVTLGLCRLRSLAIIAPYTAWQLSTGLMPPVQSFGIAYWGETSVRAFGGSVRLIVRLVRASDRVMLWADEYDLLACAQAEQYRTLSRSIVAALADAIERAEFTRFEATRPPGAYQLYLEGRQHMKVLDLPDIRRARKSFARSAEAAPSFAPALCGVARTFVLEWLLLARTEPELLHQARRIAARAVDLDPLSGESLRELGNATLFLGGIAEAIDDFARAELLSPHHADIFADHANALTHGSELAASMRRIDKAIDLNPAVPDDYLWTAGSTLFLMEDYERALSHLRQMRRPDPALRLMAACLAMSGQRAEAAVLVQRALEDQPNFRIQDWIAAIPLRSKEHVAHYAAALSEAGFI